MLEGVSEECWMECFEVAEGEFEEYQKECLGSKCPNSCKRSV